MKEHGFYIPVSRGKNILASKRILLTGDAAALADPVTAEGISAAVLSGLLAAESVIEGKLNSEIVPNLYNQKIEKHFHKDLKAGIFLSKAFYNYESLRVILMKRYGMRFCEIIADIISGERRYSRLIKNPFNYLKLIKYYFRQVPGTLKPEHNL